MTACDRFAEALVTGDALADDDRAHLTGCDRCQKLAALPALLAASASAPPPRPGFSARMMAAARTRIEQRRRRRFAGFALALATAGVLAVVVDRGLVRRSTTGGPSVSSLPAAATRLDPDLRRDLDLLRIDDAMAPVAPWQEIEAPVHNYRALLREGSPP
jgi:hypothetical protein